MNKFKLIKYDDAYNDKFYLIQHELTELSKKKNKYKPLIKPSIVCLGYVDDIMKAFIVLVQTDKMLENGENKCDSIDELHTDFMNAGGVLDKEGMLITDIKGIKKDASGLLKQLLIVLTDSKQIDYLFVHVKKENDDVSQIFKNENFINIGGNKNNNIFRLFIK
jgi:hypothetical protein